MTGELIEYLPIDAIDTKPQVRDNADDASVHNLAVALREVGQLQPIRVRRDGQRFLVVDGHRRLLAVRLLKWQRIAAIVEGKELNGADIVQRQLIANVQRKNLSGIECARAIDDLIKQTGWSATQVAGKLGFTSATVSRLRALLKLPSEVQEQVQKGVIPASTAYQIKVHGGEKKAELAGDAANGALKRDEVKTAARKKPTTATPKEKKPRFRMNVPAAECDPFLVSGPKVPLKLFISSLEELLARARDAERQGIELWEFVKQSNSKGPSTA